MGPPGPTEEIEFIGPGGEGPSRSPPAPPPGFSGHDRNSPYNDQEIPA